MAFYRDLTPFSVHTTRQYSDRMGRTVIASSSPTGWTKRTYFDHAGKVFKRTRSVW